LSLLSAREFDAAGPAGIVPAGAGVEGQLPSKTQGRCCAGGGHRFGRAAFAEEAEDVFRPVHRDSGPRAELMKYSRNKYS